MSEMNTAEDLSTTALFWKLWHKYHWNIYKYISFVWYLRNVKHFWLENLLITMNEMKAIQFFTFVLELNVSKLLLWNYTN